MNTEELSIILKDHRLWLISLRSSGTKADLSKADLSGANLARANLSRANLSEADLYEANLSGADLSGADLSGANLARANLSGANLSETDLSRADLYKVKGKLILTFSAGRHFAYYCDGVLKIGCKQLPIEDWLTHYECIGKDNNYSTETIKLYKAFMDLCNASKEEENDE